MPSLKLSSPAAEGTLSVSKWIKYPVLLDPAEMEELFLLPFELYNVSEVTKEPRIEKELFLGKYRAYADALIGNSSIPDFRRLFSSVLSVDPSLLYAMQVEGGFLVRPIKPVVQMQQHHVGFSSVDGKFHSMVFGQESISWGIQFAYPQIFQHPKSREFSKVIDTVDFPNTALFAKISRFIRDHTVPTAFVRSGVKTAVPIRLGKKCFGWINRHQDLSRQGISVHVY